jgi:very-long-chain (3R)-3-hydroxyacyl-CoA dehydratase
MKRIWLIAFNVLTLLAWTLFFVHAALHGLQSEPQSLVMLNFAQGLAVFEVMNALFGFAGANWLLTAMQVASRLLIVVLLNWIPMEILVERDVFSGFAVVSIAWSVTEIVRALFYLTELFDKPLRSITFARYTFFILLYPIGVMGEFLIMHTFVSWREYSLDIFNVALGIVAISYFVFFPKLYGHMLKQRKKKLA